MIVILSALLIASNVFWLIYSFLETPLGRTRTQIAIAEYPDNWGTLGFFLENGQDCEVDIVASAHYGSAYIGIRQIQNDWTILEREGGSACTGSFTLEFKAPATGDYAVTWDFLDSVTKIAVYRIG